MNKVALLIDKVIKLAIYVQQQINSTKLKEFICFIDTDKRTLNTINNIKTEIIEYSSKFNY